MQVFGYVVLLAHVPGPPFVGPTLLPGHTTAQALLALAGPEYPAKHEPHVFTTVEQGFLLSDAQKAAEAAEQSTPHVRPSLPSA
jgi:hypothetical protein